MISSAIASRPSAPRIDAHHHLWDPARVEYAWMTNDFAALERPFLPEDLAPELEACGVDATIVVQAANSTADTDALLELAAQTPWIAGVVAWAPLIDPSRAAPALDGLAANPTVRGIRHLAHDEPDPDWLVQPSVLESLRLVAERQLVFEVPAVYPRHLDHVPRLATRVPDLRIVIDHLGKPPRASLEDAFAHWRELMGRCAEHEHVYAKVSGLGTSGDGAPAPMEEARPAVSAALELFGADRLLLGSDWPVSTLDEPYAETFARTVDLLDGLPTNERDLVLGGTAVALYGLTPTIGQLTPEREAPRV